jgi:LytS/YehU family sensor histidine kinase
MSKSKKSQKTNRTQLQEKPLTISDNSEMLNKLLTGALTSAVVGGLFAGIAYHFTLSTNPAQYFQILGVFVGIFGAYIGSSIYKKRTNPKMGETLHMVLGAIVASSAINFVILLFFLYTV